MRDLRWRWQTGGAPVAGDADAGGAEATVLAGPGLAALARRLRAAFAEGATAIELDVPDPDAVDVGKIPPPAPSPGAGAAGSTSRSCSAAG